MRSSRCSASTLRWPSSSTKSATGHLHRCSRRSQAISVVLAINGQVAPPTINLDEPDEGYDLDFVPHTARNMDIDVVLLNSFGFGGTNTTRWCSARFAD